MEHAELWHKFKTQGCETSRAQLIAHYRYLASVTARAAARPGILSDVEDLTSTACIALVLAVEVFDQARGVYFTTFAISKMRGAILEQIRADDWVPRRAREHYRDMRGALARFEAARGRTPTNTELADAMGVDEDALAAVQAQITRMQALSLDALQTGDGATLAGLLAGTDDPVWAMVEAVEARRAVRAAVCKLPQQELRVIVLFYWHEWPMSRIAGYIGKSVERAYQIRKQALKRLRAQMDSRNAWQARG